MTMRLPLLLLPLLLCTCCLFVIAQDTTDDNVCLEEKQQQDDECSLYMAPSTIPNAGMGVFTTRALLEGSVVQPHGEVYIPIVDQMWHMNQDDWFWPLDNYYWMGNVMGMELESVDEDVEAYCPGYDSTMNSHLALHNVGKTLPNYDMTLHRHVDPGAGAITPYYNGTHSVLHDVPAGGELFKFYGNDWFETRTHTFGLIPLREHYREAERLVKKYMTIDGMSDEAKKDFWESVVIGGVGWESRTTNALPMAQDLSTVSNEGIRALHYRNATRSTEFLQQHGRCLDNISPGRSTIRQAGRGAFASRFLKQNSIITGSPLTIILDRSYLHLYGSKFTDKGKKIPDKDVILGHQLLLNYCMGHRDSNLLLCPYGTYVNYINHNQTQANVKLQWAPKGTMAQNDEFFDLEVHEMDGHYKTNLAMDYVALRDIKPGEELFLDYGNDFEDAWNKHIKNWKPGSQEYVDSYHYNEQKHDKMLKTHEEQEEDPYPSNLEMRCHSWLEEYRNYDNEEFSWSIDEKGTPCEIEERIELGEGSFVYNVRLEDNEKLEKVPRDAISFVDKPYTTDIHMEDVFRHEIGIPDDMFPDKWKNRKERND